MRNLGEGAVRLLDERSQNEVPKILRHPRPSAAYSESFYYSDNPCASQYPQRERAGKMPVLTIVEAETFPLQVNLRDRVCFQVEYNYERDYVSAPSEWVTCL